jgi:hypothetical protein
MSAPDRRGFGGAHAAIAAPAALGRACATTAASSTSVRLADHERTARSVTRTA